MNRRDTLKLIALCTGRALSLSAAAGVLNACDSRDRSAGHVYVPEVFTSDQEALFSHVAELIIPATDTPGAAEAGVSRFADHLLAHWYAPEERQVFLDGLMNLDERAIDELGEPFIDIGADRQVAMLTDLEASSNGIWMTGEAEAPSFFAMAKFLTITGYYTSEVGATRELRTDMTPGTFKGCIPYEEVGRAWSGA